MIPSTEQTASKIKPTRHPDFVPGLMMVRIKEDVVAQVPSVQASTFAQVRAFRLPEPVADPLQGLRRKGQIKEVIPVFGETDKKRTLFAKARASTAATLAFSVRHSENEDLRGINLLKLSENVDLNALEKELNGTSGIVYAHRVPARWLLSAKAKGSSEDPSVNRQWGLRAIRWFQATLPPNVGNVSVAVLDTGVDTTHPELKKYFSGSKQNHYNHDGASATDIIGHGTHVSGIIAADPANKIGIAGICDCDLRVWKIFGDQPASDGQYYVDTVMYQRALNDARNAAVKVMNLSIGGGAPSQTERLLFTRLIQAGVSVVAAMGNEFEEGNPIEYPGAYPNVIAVGAINEANERAYFSNTGKRIALCAPGTNILSTLPMKKSVARKETKYAAWDGTSMATPHVCAAAALVQAKHPKFLPADITKKLTDTAAKVPAMGSQKWTNEYGSGLLDLEAALK